MTVDRARVCSAVSRLSFGVGDEEKSVCVTGTKVSTPPFRFDHTNMTAPLPVCSAKLSMFWSD